ncbi:hypothetical protein H0X06_07245 [Candidatus Dependentiae bacterium]|nr:hypothetical protein [Candidatus Dependentiae bacterium]
MKKILLLTISGLFTIHTYGMELTTKETTTQDISTCNAFFTIFTIREVESVLRKHLLMKDWICIGLTAVKTVACLDKRFLEFFQENEDFTLDFLKYLYRVSYQKDFEFDKALLYISPSLNKEGIGIFNKNRSSSDELLGIFKQCKQDNCWDKALTTLRDFKDRFLLQHALNHYWQDKWEDRLKGELICIHPCKSTLLIYALDFGAPKKVIEFLVKEKSLADQNYLNTPPPFIVAFKKFFDYNKQYELHGNKATLASINQELNKLEEIIVIFIDAGASVDCVFEKLFSAPNTKSLEILTTSVNAGGECAIYHDLEGVPVSSNYSMIMREAEDSKKYAFKSKFLDRTLILDWTTPLNLALQENNVKMVQYLLKKNLKLSSELSSMMIANTVIQGNMSQLMLTFLISECDNRHILLHNLMDKTTLASNYIYKKDTCGLLQQLIEQDADINAIHEGKTLLDIAISCYDTSPDVIDSLCKKGAQGNSLTNFTLKFSKWWKELDRDSVLPEEEILKILYEAKEIIIENQLYCNDLTVLMLDLIYQLISKNLLLSDTVELIKLIVLAERKSFNCFVQFPNWRLVYRFMRGLGRYHDSNNPVEFEQLASFISLLIKEEIIKMNDITFWIEKVREEVHRSDLEKVAHSKDLEEAARRSGLDDFIKRISELYLKTDKI